MKYLAILALWFVPVTVHAQDIASRSVAGLWEVYQNYLAERGHNVELCEAYARTYNRAGGNLTEDQRTIDDATVLPAMVSVEACR